MPDKHNVAYGYFHGRNLIFQLNYPIGLISFLNWDSISYWERPYVVAVWKIKQLH